MRITSESLRFSTTYNRTIAVLTSSHLSLNGTSSKDGPAGWKAKGFVVEGPAEKEASGNKKGRGSISKTVTTKAKWEARQRSICMNGRRCQARLETSCSKGRGGNHFTSGPEENENGFQSPYTVTAATHRRKSEADQETQKETGQLHDHYGLALHGPRKPRNRNTALPPAQFRAHNRRQS